MSKYKLFWKTKQVCDQNFFHLVFTNDLNECRNYCYTYTIAA